MESNHRERFHELLLAVLASSVPKPAYGTITLHSLTELLSSQSTTLQPLQYLDKCAVTLCVKYSLSGDEYDEKAKKNQSPTFISMLRDVSKLQLGAMQHGYPTLTTLLRCLQLPFKQQIESLQSLDGLALSLTPLPFRQSCSSADALIRLGQILDKQSRLPQPGLITLSALYTILTRAPDDTNLRERALVRMEVFAANLLQEMVDPERALLL